MPIYDYKGLRHNGAQVKGHIDGDSARTARLKLRAQEIYPTEIEERTVEGQPRGRGLLQTQVGGRVKLMDIAIMTKQCATLVGAHIPLVESLSALSKQVENEKLRIVLTDVKEKVNEGMSLAQAMSQHPKIFSNVYVNMVKVGEASGTLDIVMARLADFTEAQVALKNKITMTFDAFTNETFTGSVFYIDPAQTTTGGVVGYKIKVALDKKDSRMKSGLTANMNIETRHKDNVLILPQYAILQNDKGTFVEILQNSKVKDLPVTLGLQDQKGNVEIISGVTLGEAVLNIGLKSK